MVDRNNLDIQLLPRIFKATRSPSFIMSMLPRSNRPHGGMNKVIKQESDYLGDQINEFKESAPVQDQLTDNQISECNADKNMRRMGINKFGSGVIGLNIEVITIQAGEDIATKIMSFSRNGWAVYIMSANGAVSNVTVRHGAFSHETVVYEGYFEILSLSGLYQPSETDGMCSRRSGLSVSLADHDGRVFGGGVAGPLTAASLVHVVIGRFPADEEKKLKLGTASGIPAASSSSQRGALTGSFGRPRSPPKQSASGSINTSSN